MNVFLRGDVLEFAQSMEAKLRTKDVEFGQLGWGDSSCSISFLIERLEEEIQELKNAFSDCEPDKVKKETADVGNFAMMIHARLIAKYRRKYADGCISPSQRKE